MLKSQYIYFWKLMSFMLHVVSYHLVLYLYSIYVKSNLKFFITYFMCILCKSRIMYQSICIFVHHHHVLILYNTAWVSYGAVFHVSTINCHVVSCAILVSHVMYVILIIYLTMFFNFQGIFWNTLLTYLNTYICTTATLHHM